MKKAATALCVAMWLASPSLAAAHDGPPYPIVNDRRAGPYVMSVWTDPDTTDDETPGGQFWVTFTGDNAGGASGDVHVTITATPLRGGPERSVEAVADNTGSHFGALVLDHEGRFRIDVRARGAQGDGDVSAEVDATYDLRPAPFVVVLYAVPFVLAGVLWVRLLLRRRNAGRHPAGPAPRGPAYRAS